MDESQKSIPLAFLLLRPTPTIVQSILSKKEFLTFRIGIVNRKRKRHFEVCHEGFSSLVKGSIYFSPEPICPILQCQPLHPPSSLQAPCHLNFSTESIASEITQRIEFDPMQEPNLNTQSVPYSLIRHYNPGCSVKPCFLLASILHIHGKASPPSPLIQTTSQIHTLRRHTTASTFSFGHGRRNPGPHAHSAARRH